MRRGCGSVGRPPYRLIGSGQLRAYRVGPSDTGALRGDVRELDRLIDPTTAEENPSEDPHQGRARDHNERARRCRRDGRSDHCGCSRTRCWCRPTRHERSQKEAERVAAERAKTAAASAQLALFAESDNWLGRLSPRRNPWPELQELDERIAQLDLGQAAAGADVHRLEQELRDAEAADTGAFAGWHAEGAKGARPHSTAPAVQALLVQAQADRDSGRRRTR